MQGMLFVDRDYGQGGWAVPHHPCEMVHWQIWCVDLGGARFHIESHDITKHLSDSARKEVSVKPCDDSCKKLTNIPDDIWKVASSKIK